MGLAYGTESELTNTPLNGSRGSPIRWLVQRQMTPGGCKYSGIAYIDTKVSVSIAPALVEFASIHHSISPRHGYFCGLVSVNNFKHQSWSGAAQNCRGNDVPMSPAKLPFCGPRDPGWPKSTPCRPETAPGCLGGPRMSILRSASISNFALVL